MVTTPDLAALAARLSEAQRDALRWSHPGERRMGGFCGLSFDAPELVESWGINHPIFGAHYRLTPLGEQVRTHLKDQNR